MNRLHPESMSQRKWPIAVVFLILFAAELFGIIELQRRYRIADIITDEAEWDLRDNADM